MLAPDSVVTDTTGADAGADAGKGLPSGCDDNGDCTDTVLHAMARNGLLPKLPGHLMEQSVALTDQNAAWKTDVFGRTGKN